MKAMVLEQFGAPLVLRDVPVPKLGAQDTLIRVGACGICGTDLKIQAGKVPTVTVPRIMGHEIAGTVVDVGADVKTVKPGDRVVAASHITCGGCYYCRVGKENLCQHRIGRFGTEVDGAFAEFLWAPARGLCLVPDNVTMEEASICGGAMATPIRSLRTRGRVTYDDVVVILGVGGLGIHGLQIAKELGAHTIAVDVVPAKLDLALKLGAELAINAREENPGEAILRFTGGQGADVLVEMSGGMVLTQAISDCAAGVRKSGRIVLVGYEYGAPLTLQSAYIVDREIEVLGSLAYTRQDLADTVKMVANGRVKPQLAATYELTAANEALADLRRSEGTGRLVLLP